MNRRNFLKVGRYPAPSASRGPGYYTNAALQTHDGRTVKFYDDVIKDKVVLINFMYTNCEGACPPAMAKLVRIQQALGDRVGRDIHMYSITLKPEEDDPAALKRYAEMHGVKPGWTLLTGDPFDLESIRFRLFRWDHPGLDFNLDQHTGMFRIINDRIDRWSMAPAIGSMRLILDSVAWAGHTKPLAVRLQENAARQAVIDAEARGSAVASTQ